MLTLLKRASDFGFRRAYDPLQNKRAVPRCHRECQNAPLALCRASVTRRAVAQRRSRASGLTRLLAEAIRRF